jgi:hypothetical protein
MDNHRTVFISSCTRRQLSRRRPARRAIRLELLVVLIVLVGALGTIGAVVAGRGGM